MSLKSFFKALFRIKHHIPPDVREQGLHAAAEVIEAVGDASLSKYLDRPQADVVASAATAAGRLAKDLRHVDNAAMRMGPLLVIKYTEGGKSYIRATTMTPSLARSLDQQPQLLDHPKSLYSRIAAGTPKHNALPARKENSVEPAPSPYSSPAAGSESGEA